MYRLLPGLALFSGLFCLLTPIAIAQQVPAPSSTSLSPKNLSDEPQASIAHSDSSDLLAKSKQTVTTVESSRFNAKLSHSAADLLPIEPTYTLTSAQAEVNSGVESQPAFAESNPESTPDSADKTEAEKAAATLAQKAQNPIANLISLPFQNNTNFGVGNLNRTQNTLNIQPVIPFDLNEDWLIVSRTILPIIYQPALTQTQESHFGLGDLNPSLFFVPKNNSKITWGLGPVFLLPTATAQSLGTGKWGIGPTAVIVLTDAPWVVGALANNIWSIAGDDSRPDVSQFLLQPFINYNLADGWYLVSSPIITANWKASSGNQWTVPIGGGFGKLFRIGRQPVNATLQAYWNVEKPTGGADWLIRFQFQLLFPKN